VTAAAQSPASSGAVAELRRGSSVVRVGAERGAPILSFACDGYDWCAAGAWIDQAPSAGACALPTYVAGVPRGALPEGGLLAVESPDVEVRADGASESITAVWPASSYPLSWTRTIQLDADGALVVRYAVGNAQTVPVPFIWNLKMPLPWNSSVSLDMPRAARARLSASHGDGLPAAGSEFAWPALRDGGKLVDLARPTRLAPLRALNCYLELSQGRFRLHGAGAALDVEGESGVVTHAHVWANNDAMLPGSAARRWWRRHTPQRELAVGPAVGAPGVLSDAVGAWDAAHWAEPGDTVRWTVRFRPTSPTT
jgi:hypothetical protein